MKKKKKKKRPNKSLQDTFGQSGALGGRHQVRICKCISARQGAGGRTVCFSSCMNKPDREATQRQGYTRRLHVAKTCQCLCVFICIPVPDLRQDGPKTWQRALTTPPPPNTTSPASLDSVSALIRWGGLLTTVCQEPCQR